MENSQMLDYVRGRSSGITADERLETALDEQEEDVEDVDYTKYLNTPPGELMRMLESEKDENERQAMEKALSILGAKDSNIEYEELDDDPFENEPREAVHAENMREVAGFDDSKINEHLTASESEPESAEETGTESRGFLGGFRDMGVIDFEYLRSLGPAPVSHGWFE